MKINWKNVVCKSAIVGIAAWMLIGCEMPAESVDEPDVEVVTEAPADETIDEDRKIIVDDVTEVLLTYDEDSLAYDEMLAYIKEYLNGEHTDQETMDMLDGYLDSIEETISQWEECEFTDAYYDLLMDYDMTVDEVYQVMNMRPDNLEIYQTYASIIKEYLIFEQESVNQEESEDAKEDLEFVIEMDLKMQLIDRDDWCYMANGLFGHWGDEVAPYILAQTREQFQSFYSEDTKWYTSEEEFYDRQKKNEEAMIALNFEYAAFLGKEQLELDGLLEGLEEIF